MLIIVLFLSVLMKWNHGVFICLVFVACLGSLISSLVTFICNIYLSLVVLKLELKAEKLDLG